MFLKPPRSEFEGASDNGPRSRVTARDKTRASTGDFNSAHERKWHRVSLEGPKQPRLSLLARIQAGSQTP